MIVRRLLLAFSPDRLVLFAGPLLRARFDFDGLWLVLRECSSDYPSRLDDSPSGIACGPRRIRKASLTVGLRHVSTLALGDECSRRSDEIWLNHLAVALSQVFPSIGEA